MSHKRLFTLILTSAIALLTTTAVLAATQLVDHFTTGSQNFSAVIPDGGGTDVQSNSVAASAVLGLERDVVVTATGDLNGSLQESRFRTLFTGGGRASIATDPDVQSFVRLDWDGTDGNALNLNPNGLGGFDLTDGSTNSGLFLSILFDDRPVVATFRVYSGTNWSYYTLQLPGFIDQASNRVDFFVPFSFFSTGGGSGVNFNSVGAVSLEIDGSASPGFDLVLDTVEASSRTEYGDLPDVYSTTLVSDGARHVLLTGLRLGNSLDSEADGNPSSTATGDDTQSTPDDEDGVLRPSSLKWTPGITGSLLVTVKGCQGVCYLHGWVDWNSDNSFSQVGDEIINRTVGDGTSTNTFNVPASAAMPGTLYARFRLCGGASGSNDCGTPSGASTTGEVEDYAWDFGPLAVTLESLQAQPVTTSPVLPLALVGGAAVILIGTVFFTRRGRKHTA